MTDAEKKIGRAMFIMAGLAVFGLIAFGVIVATLIKVWL